ncbi:MAG: Electron transport complex protein RnfC [Lentisphaerae bacterium ADurb.Bin242]|nr:MAG: Electron transport complex protein RnfC [Lentisphaerae bacterium ADurb.Bin242]
MNIHPKQFKGGIHPADGKELSSAGDIREAPLLEKYMLVAQQNIGAPPKVIVNKGDTVKKGQLVAEAAGFVSVPLHAPTSGTVGEILDIPGANGAPVSAIEILSDGRDEWYEAMTPYPDWKNVDRELLSARIRDAGIVGMGGASFPTHVKLSPPPEKTIDTLIVNGSECEPYLTADDRLMRESPEKILTGAAITAKILKVSRILVGVEENKPEAIEALKKHADKNTEIVPLHVRYPQGGEKQLIYALTGRKVVAGGLPMDVGCVVQNVGTLAAICDAVVEGRPLIERVVTVTGEPVKEPGNFRLRLGTPVRKALEFAGGIKAPVAKLVLGGPMMGFAQSSLDVTVSKNTSGILLLGPESVFQYESGPCLSCGRCVVACPMGLLVSTLSKVCENERYDLAEENYVTSCLECGICTYVCPAGRPNVQHFRRAKAEINARNRKNK